MPIPTQFPWRGVAIVVVTVLSLYVLVVLTLKAAEWTSSARDELRDRYASARWKPAPVDILAMPVWVALEIVCFAGAIAFALFAVLVAYQVAKGARDWWHAGDRERRR